MARKLPRKDAVIVGLGWTGSILAHELTDAGLDVVAVERGPWRDTAVLKEQHAGIGGAAGTQLGCIHARQRRRRRRPALER